MAKGVLFASVAVVTVGFVAIVIFMMAMMVPMMGSGHMAMMGGGGSNPAEETPVEGVTQVRVEDFAFAPANIVVDIGTAVTWTNHGSFAHTVTSDEGEELASGLFGPDETFSHTFDEPGEYAYHCQPHPNMRGLVKVRAPGAG